MSMWMDVWNLGRRCFRPTAFAFTAFTACIGFSGNAAWAGKTLQWKHVVKTDFEKGDLEGLTLEADGSLSLARTVSQNVDLKAGSAWDVAALPDGRRIAATAEPGAVVAVAEDGKLTELWRDEKRQAFCLLPQEDGSLLVGTGPSGQVLRIAADGKVSDWFQVDGLYVWDLIAGPDGKVYAATGPKGKIHEITGEKKGRVIHAAEQKHVLCLALAPHDRLIAGVDGPGLVLAVDLKGKPMESGELPTHALYDAGGLDVRSLWVDASGTIFAGTAGVEKMGSGPKATNHVVRIEPTGGVRKFSASATLFQALAPWGDDANGVVAGVGPKGRLQRLSAAGEWSEAAKLDVEHVLAVRPAPNGELLLGTGNPARFAVLSARSVERGVYTSPALDAGSSARVGSASWLADLPTGAKTVLQVRTGNTETPGPLWSSWSSEITNPAVAADCPVGRFVQYRLTLSRGESSKPPTLRGLTLHYRTLNQPPTISKVTLPRMTDGDGKKLTTSLKIEWTATDPNQDELRTKLWYRKTTWPDWVRLGDDLTTSSHDWDVSSVPEGEYWVKTVVDDGPSNPAEDIMETSLTSEAVPIDRAPPKVTLKTTSTGPKSVRASARAVDTMSRLASASYALDSGDWTPVFPDDRLFDSLDEPFTFDLPNLSPGLHVLVLRATDASGHTSSADVVFTVK